jgi:hypothetical protein
MCIVIERSIQENLNIKLKAMSDSRFVKMLKGKHPEVNVDKLLEIFNAKITEIQKIQGTEDLRLPLDCDLNKAVIASVISEYLKE